MTHTLELLSVYVPLLSLVLLLPLLGRSRRGVLCGVTVPLQYADSAEAKAALRRFRSTAALVNLGLVGVSLLLEAHNFPRTWPRTPFLVLGICLSVLLCWRREAKLMRRHAVKVPLERATELSIPRANRAFGMTLAASLPLAASAFWLKTHWQQIPERWPQHWNAAGQVDAWGTRTTAGVYMPLVMGACVLLVMLGVVGFMSFASGAGTSQRHRFLSPIAALSWILSILFCSIALLPLAHLGAAAIALILFLHIPLTLCVVVWMFWRGGMSRSGALSSVAEPYDGTPDNAWRAGGLIYVNRADYALLVPKRFGIGWTLNFGRPAAWAFLAVILLLILASATLPGLMK